MLAREVEVGTGGVPLGLPQPYLLFLGDTVEPGYAKTAFGLRDWAPEKCVGEFALPSATVTTGLPRMTPREAHSRGARALVIGVANSGGFIADSWLPALVEALEAGLDIISGMHARLGDLQTLATAANRLGRRLIDVRVPPAQIPIATGLKRSGKRLLTVGTDCALGKKYTALSIARAFLKDAPIVILDEPTGALDKIAEGQVVEAVDRLRKDRTTFVVAHRLSTVKDADRIIVLDAGRVAAQGTHDELLDQSPLYQQLAKGLVTSEPAAAAA